jgi:hypothetical protein
MCNELNDRRNAAEPRLLYSSPTRVRAASLRISLRTSAVTVQVLYLHCVTLGGCAHSSVITASATPALSIYFFCLIVCEQRIDLDPSLDSRPDFLFRVCAKDLWNSPSRLHHDIDQLFHSSPVDQRWRDNGSSSSIPVPLMGLTVGATPALFHIVFA